MIRVWIALVVLVAAGVAAHAQDAPKSMLDNDRVRAYELRVPPGSKLGLRGQGYQFVYMITDGILVFNPPGRTPYELTLRAGEVSLLPSQAADSENGGNRELRALVVELKGGARGGEAVAKGKGRARAAAKGKPRGRHARRGN